MTRKNYIRQICLINEPNSIQSSHSDGGGGRLDEGGGREQFPLDVGPGE